MPGNMSSGQFDDKWASSPWQKDDNSGSDPLLPRAAREPAAHFQAAPNLATRLEGQRLPSSRARASPWSCTLPIGRS
jgi:hypothetical protein